MANKTIWALEDIIAHCLELEKQLAELEAAYNRIVKIARNHYEVPVLKELVVVQACMLKVQKRYTAIERLAREARQGEYTGERQR